MTHTSAVAASTDANKNTANTQLVAQMLASMTLEEKIGQMSQLNSCEGHVSDHLAWAIKAGRVGSVINEVDVETVNELQRLAVEESRLGIPLLIGRDVIHGFQTIFPIPLGQAASWNANIIRKGAEIAAHEASASGVNWTFAPMMDIARDPRWGRIAESFGEDPYLASSLSVAMIEGFQGTNMAEKGRIAACAKHFAGYGAAESGRDYATTNIPENELRNVYLQPFRAAAAAGVASFMTSFSDLNGVPASANQLLLKTILREEWQYPGFVVSDWESIHQLLVHGFTPSDRESAFEAVNAGVDMEMVSTTYADHLQSLIDEERIDIAKIDTMVAYILQAKYALGLFESPYTNPSDFRQAFADSHLSAAKTAAIESCVLLKNKGSILPLAEQHVGSLAVIGPLADDGYEQLGTWVFDCVPERSETCLRALQQSLEPSSTIRHAKGLQTSRSHSHSGFTEAREIAELSDTVVMFLGEESILSGEAHSRADISLPGAQLALVDEVRKAGKPIVAVIIAGRPLTIGDLVEKVDAVLFAWHPGTMAGPAIADLLLGVESPSGKLPVCFPRAVGQIPIYYGQKNTGKPPTPESVVHIDDIDAKAPQTSLGMTAFHLDAGYTPLFPFGYGLSYTSFEYTNIELSSNYLKKGQAIKVSATVRNSGQRDAHEVVQLYVRDLVGNVTRPVKELKGFRKIRLALGESETVCFTLRAEDLAFYGRNMTEIVEAGHYHVWIGSSSEPELWSEFELV